MFTNNVVLLWNNKKKVPFLFGNSPFKISSTELLNNFAYQYDKCFKINGFENIVIEQIYQDSRGIIGFLADFNTIYLLHSYYENDLTVDPSKFIQKIKLDSSIVKEKIIRIVINCHDSQNYYIFMLSEFGNLYRWHNADQKIILMKNLTHVKNIFSTLSHLYVVKNKSVYLMNNDTLEIITKVSDKETIIQAGPLHITSHQNIMYLTISGVLKIKNRNNGLLHEIKNIKVVDHHHYPCYYVDENNNVNTISGIFEKIKLPENITNISRIGNSGFKFSTVNRNLFIYKNNTLNKLERDDGEQLVLAQNSDKFNNTKSAKKYHYLD